MHLDSSLQLAIRAFLVAEAVGIFVNWHFESNLMSFVGMINVSLFQSSPNLGIDWRTTDYKGVKSAPGGMAARDTALRAYAKVLRQYHKEATYLSSSSCS